LFWLLEMTCRSLVSLARTTIIIGLWITSLYALLVWRHLPAEEPRTLLVCLTAGLLITNLGEQALEGQYGPSAKVPFVMLIVIYWFPVAGLSKLLQAF
jgi:hypothetical protein